MPQTEVDPALVITIAETPKDRKPSPGQSVVLGNGWYANVEVDSQDRVHLAWTDADIGNVMYAVSPPGKLAPLSITTVESEGAVGSHLLLALAPGDVPMLLYYHQDRKMLRLAYRQTDLEILKSRGVAVSDKKVFKPGESVEVPGVKSRNGVAGMSPGWLGEDVAHGQEAGRAGAFFIDERGRPHVAYYGAKERFRYMRRPAELAAFGEAAIGIWEKFTVDEKAGGSHTMSTSMHVDGKGNVLLSYANWNFLDSQVKLARLQEGQDTFSNEAIERMQSRVDGWHSDLIKNNDGSFSLYSVATGDEKVYRVPVRNGKAIIAERSVMMDRPGHATIKRSGKDLFILTRGTGLDSIGEIPGVWLVTVPNENAKNASRIILEKSPAADAWFDLAVRANGKPVAVWSSRVTKSVKLYAP